MPKLLDLFCGAGGCSMGYFRAGFDVTGVDTQPQPSYPFKFIQANALTFDLSEFDVIHASPPCQAYSRGGNKESRKKHPRLLEPIQQKLYESGKPYIIENVVGAPLKDPILLCGTMFDLKVLRHRLFECSPSVGQPSHPKHQGTVSDGQYYGVYTGGRPGCFGNNEKRYKLSVPPVEVWQGAMGIPWMNRYELTQAIPPAYTEWLGKQILNILTLTLMKAGDANA